MRWIVVVVLCVVAAACRELCTAENCGGCCDRAGECVFGTQNDACGKGGACGVCSAGTSCVRQSCVTPDGGTAGGTGGGNVGGGSGGGAAGCLIGSCGALTCNPTTGQCEAGATCDTSRAQPADCGGGKWCSAGTCSDVVRPCGNFGSASAPQAWSPLTKFGPVIYASRNVSFQLDDAGCPRGSERRAVAELAAYDFMGRFLEDGGTPQLLMYRPNATFGVVREGVSVSRSGDGRNATLTISTCGSPSDLSLTLGFAFADGNGQCVRWP